MIDEKDIDLYLKAKKDRLAIEILSGLSIVFLAVLVFFEAADIYQEYTVLLAVTSVVLSASAFGKSRWVSVSRTDLLKAMERMVNSDAEALRIIANKKKA